MEWLVAKANANVGSILAFLVVLVSAAVYAINGTLEDILRELRRIQR